MIGDALGSLKNDGVNVGGKRFQPKAGGTKAVGQDRLPATPKLSTSRVFPGSEVKVLPTDSLVVSAVKKGEISNLDAFKIGGVDFLRKFDDGGAQKTLLDIAIDSLQKDDNREPLIECIIRLLELGVGVSAGLIGSSCLHKLCSSLDEQDSAGKKVLELIKSNFIKKSIVEELLSAISELYPDSDDLSGAKEVDVLSSMMFEIQEDVDFLSREETKTFKMNLFNFLQTLSVVNSNGEVNKQVLNLFSYVHILLNGKNSEIKNFSFRTTLPGTPLISIASGGPVAKHAFSIGSNIGIEESEGIWCELNEKGVLDENGVVNAELDLFKNDIDLGLVTKNQADVNHILFILRQSLGGCFVFNERSCSGTFKNHTLALAAIIYRLEFNDLKQEQGSNSFEERYLMYRLLHDHKKFRQNIPDLDLVYSYFAKVGKFSDPRIQDFLGIIMGGQPMSLRLLCLFRKVNNEYFEKLSSSSERPQSSSIGPQLVFFVWNTFFIYLQDFFYGSNAFFEFKKKVFENRESVEKLHSHPFYKYIVQLIMSNCGYEFKACMEKHLDKFLIDFMKWLINMDLDLKSSIDSIKTLIELKKSLEQRDSQRLSFHDELKRQLYDYQRSYYEGGEGEAGNELIRNALIETMGFSIELDTEVGIKKVFDCLYVLAKIVKSLGGELPIVKLELTVDHEDEPELQDKLDFVQQVFGKSKEWFRSVFGIDSGGLSVTVNEHGVSFGGQNCNDFFKALYKLFSLENLQSEDVIYFVFSKDIDESFFNLLGFHGFISGVSYSQINKQPSINRVKLLIDSVKEGDCSSFHCLTTPPSKDDASLFLTFDKSSSAKTPSIQGTKRTPGTTPKRRAFEKKFIETLEFEDPSAFAIYQKLIGNVDSLMKGKILEFLVELEKNKHLEIKRQGTLPEAFLESRRAETAAELARCSQDIRCRTESQVISPRARLQSAVKAVSTSIMLGKQGSEGFNAIAAALQKRIKEGDDEGVDTKKSRQERSVEVKRLTEGISVEEKAKNEALLRGIGNKYNGEGMSKECIERKAELKRITVLEETKEKAREALGVVFMKRQEDQPSSRDAAPTALNEGCDGKITNGSADDEEMHPGSVTRKMSYAALSKLLEEKRKKAELQKDLDTRKYLAARSVVSRNCKPADPSQIEKGRRDFYRTMNKSAVELRFSLSKKGMKHLIESYMEERNSFFTKFQEVFPESLDEAAYNDFRDSPDQVKTIEEKKDKYRTFRGKVMSFVELSDLSTIDGAMKEKKCLDEILKLITSLQRSLIIRSGLNLKMKGLREIIEGKYNTDESIKNGQVKFQPSDMKDAFQKLYECLENIDREPISESKALELMNDHFISECSPISSAQFDSLKAVVRDQDRWKDSKYGGYVKDLKSNTSTHQLLCRRKDGSQYRKTFYKINGLKSQQNKEAHPHIYPWREEVGVVQFAAVDFEGGPRRVLMRTFENRDEIPELTGFNLPVEEFELEGGLHDPENQWIKIIGEGRKGTKIIQLSQEMSVISDLTSEDSKPTTRQWNAFIKNILNHYEGNACVKGYLKVLDPSFLCFADGSKSIYTTSRDFFTEGTLDKESRAIQMLNVANLVYNVMTGDVLGNDEDIDRDLFVKKIQKAFDNKLIDDKLKKLLVLIIEETVETTPTVKSDLNITQPDFRVDFKLTFVDKPDVDRILDRINELERQEAKMLDRNKLLERRNAVRNLECEELDNEREVRQVLDRLINKMAFPNQEEKTLDEKQFCSVIVNEPERLEALLLSNDIEERTIRTELNKDKSLSEDHTRYEYKKPTKEDGKYVVHKSELEPRKTLEILKLKHKKLSSQLDFAEFVKKNIDEIVEVSKHFGIPLVDAVDLDLSNLHNTVKNNLSVTFT